MLSSAQVAKCGSVDMGYRSSTCVEQGLKPSLKDFEMRLCDKSIFIKNPQNH